MPVAKKVAADNGEINVMEIGRGHIRVCVLGTTPLIFNRMSQKTWWELLAPKGKKSASDKASQLKHNPIQEFRDSPYVLEDNSLPTLLGVMASGFKGGMKTAALRMSGVTKTEIAQMVYVQDAFVGIYGIPHVFMAITRSADMNKTPDVRTRALLPEWACYVDIDFAKPQLREQSVVNLLAAAGFMSGIGDWRQEKGSGNYGSFKIVDEDNRDFQRIIKTCGRKVQRDALDHPVAFNDETQEMLAWFDQEADRRGFDANTGKPKVSKSAVVTTGDLVAAGAGTGKRGSKVNGAAAH